MKAESLIYHHDGVRHVGEIYPPRGSANGRAVLVIHEADGIGNNVRRRCALLSELGYWAAAADLHGGGRVLSGDAMSSAVERLRLEPALLRARIGVALKAMAHVTGCGPAHLAAIGYCFGGMAVLELARSGAKLAGVASFHGLLTSAAPARPHDIKTRIFVATGARDPLVPPDDLAAFQAEMFEADADWQLLIYGRALHSFTNRAVDELRDPRMAYDASADAASWAALITFLEESFGAADNILPS
ncbi:dienelactone hydrolase family protein [Sphingomonas crocodyli]|uniref:Dienelactone hydrolase family protein n=1 Tax=Sphingomonas crocodyli TaxID=1979270 RepID=A0A437LYI0_9SPHN|nr:dienelactone hydrolase family protein [Sphingomonas crocodyli]RVT90374.1 dienelactone hydrolase family protein [Sphingomonas crocodyli]